MSSDIQRLQEFWGPGKWFQRLGSLTFTAFGYLNTLSEHFSDTCLYKAISLWQRWLRQTGDPYETLYSAVTSAGLNRP